MRSDGRVHRGHVGLPPERWPLSHPARAADHPAIQLLPADVFLMTSAFEGRRAGVFVRSVQLAGEFPALLCIAMRKGHWIEPLIRDSHALAIHVIDAADALLRRKFGGSCCHQESADPFDCLPVTTLRTGAPIVVRCRAAIDCEVVRHLDIESDHEVFIGHIMASRVFSSNPESARRSARRE